MIVLLFAILFQILTANYDNNGTGGTAAENQLTPSNVASSFGLRCSVSIDGQSFAQPLFIPALSNFLDYTQGT